MTDIEPVRCGLLRADEVEALVVLAHRVWQAHYPGIISPAQIDYMLAQRYKPALIRQTLARGDRWAVARAGTELVGFAHGYDLGEGDYKLDKLYVDPTWQRHGIGRGLLDILIRHAQGRGCGRLVVRVNRHNGNAIAAYRHYGFTIASEIAEEIGAGFVMDDYVMTKDLPD